MSMYNQIFGYDPLAPLVLTLLGYRVDDVPRFRDAMIVKDGDKVVLLIYTRTGGGNRADYEEANKRLQSHKAYIRDEDAPNDSTYAYFFFELSPLFTEELGEEAAQRIDDIASRQLYPHEKFQKFLQDMQLGVDTEDTRRGKELGKEIAEKLQQAMDGEGPPIIEV